MKNLILRLSAVSVLVCAAHTASAGVFTWNWTNGVSADMNWSDSTNWSPAGVPGAGDTVVFNSLNSSDVAPGPGLNVAGGGQAQIVSANFNSYIDASFTGTISALVCSNLASSYQNVLLAPNTTLSITNTGGFVVGNGTTPGSGGNEYGTQTQFMTVAGTNATVKVTNTNALFWVTFGSNAGGSPVNTLDMSALDNFSATVSRMFVGVPALNRPGGICYLAATNTITCGFQTTSTETSDTVGTGAIDIGDPTSNNGGDCYLYLGAVNTIKADTICIARQKSTHGLLQFNPNLTNGTATFSGFSGNRISVWSMSDGVVNSGTTSTSATADFSIGTVNAMVNTMNVGRASANASGSGASTGTLTFGSGTFDVNTMNVGLQTLSTGKNGIGTVNVNSNSTLGVAATLIVNTNLVLGQATGGTGAATTSGTLNINGGTARINNIIASTASIGSISTINQTSGVLAITNSAGTVAAPITTMNLDGTLQLSVGGAAPEVVAATLNINGPVTIHIASIPILHTNQITFTLIKTINPIGGDPTQITNDALPVVNGVPTQGYVTNDAANSSIDLVITNGYVPIGVDIWTGLSSSNWDTVTANFSLFGVSTLYQDGVNVQFDDTGIATNVNLTANLQPGSLTVSNILKSYTFSGPGSIGGATPLFKEGSAQLTFNNSGSNSFDGGIIIGAGAVQFGEGSTNGNIPNNGAPITDNGTLAIDHSDSVALPSAISGTGSVVQSGPGVLSLSASNSYNGATLVTNGSLMLDGYIGGLSTSLLTNAAGTTIGGVGTNLGTFNAAGNVSPGDVNAVGTLTTANGLTLSPGASATFDVNPSDSTMGDGVNDLLQITGDLTLNNNPLNVRIQGIPQGQTYGVITYSGNLIGSFNPVIAGTHYSATIDTNSQPGQVNVVINGGVGANLKWSSTSSGVWDAGVSTNWLNLGTAGLDVFDSGDSVTFDDSVPNVQSNITIGAGIVLYPTTITNDSSAENYTISGAGTIAGPATLVKDGSSTLTISTANSFTGGVNVLNGTIKPGNGTALGTNSATEIITIASGATLDVNGQNLGTQQIEVSGAGVGGNGALINSGAAQETAYKNVQLTGDVVIGGLGRWDIRGSGATLNTAGTPCNITKIGTNQVSLVACVCNDNNLENVDIQQGIFAIQTSSTQYGDPNGTITVHSNALLDLWALPAGLQKNIVLNDGGGIYSESGSTAISGTVTLNTNALGGPGTCVLTNNTSTTLIVNSTIQGSGNLLKNGPAVTQLAAPNTYTGTTTVAAGTLSLTNSGTFSTNTITINSGAILDVSSVSPLTLVAGQTLQGSGALNGSLVAPDGSVVAPGTPTATGTLSVTDGGTVTLGGTTQIKLSKNGALLTSDNINAPGGISFGGTLSLSVLSGTLVGGETFQLFTSGSGDLSGTFTLSPATPGPGLVWDASNLAVNGTLLVSALPRPKLTLTAGPTPGTLTLNSSISGTLYSAATVNGPWTLVGPISGSVNINVSLSTPAKFYEVTVP